MFSFKKTRHLDNFDMKCFKCKKSDTELERFGTKFAVMSDTVKNKMKQTNLQRYGYDSPLQLEKTKDTCRKRYNTDYPFQNKDVLIKGKKTIIEKYNTENVLKKDSPFYEKAKLKNQQVCLEKYNCISSFGSAEVQQKAKETNLKKYNCEYPSQNKEIQLKAQQTRIQRYGMPYYSQTEESRHHRKFKYKYENEDFDSSWELALWIYAKDHKEEIVREPLRFKYYYNGLEHYYFPDFEYKGKLVEVKGKQFFKKDGTMQNPYDHRLDGLFEAKHQCMISNNVQIFMETELKNVFTYIRQAYPKGYLEQFKSLPNR